MQRQLVRPRLGQQHAVRSFKVEIEHQGNTITLDMPEGQSILEVALDKGIDLPHDCKLGVCMTCPAKLVRLVRLHMSIFRRLLSDPSYLKFENMLSL
jgi:hypothetical protein